MRLYTMSLVFALLTVSSAGCAVTSGDTENSQSDELGGATSLTSFTLTVSGIELVLVTSASGTNQCDGTCTFSYPAGTALSVQAQANQADCLQFRSWEGACLGQGNPCQLGLKSDVSTKVDYGKIPGCVPQ